MDSFDINCVGVSFVLQDQLFQEEKGLLVISLKWKNKFWFIKYLYMYRFFVFAEVAAEEFHMECGMVLAHFLGV